MATKTNDVTLFSNGIGHFRRVYTVSSDQPQKISIPFKRDNIGDVASSLQVFGQVKLNSPPSFTPCDADATALKIDQNCALKSLIRNLSGTAVRVTHTNSTRKDYTLLGLDTEPSKGSNGETTTRDFVILMDSDGYVRRLPMSDLQDINFIDESIRTEITKALKQNFQKIKPDSTLLDLSLSPSTAGETEAVVQYTIPVAAWKMRYAVREHKGQFSLEGAAIIDNNTDEDWDNFRVSVVTGNPISFQTDIANICVPQRKLIRLVDGEVLGNVGVQETVSASSAGSPAGSRQLRQASVRGGKFSLANHAQFGLESVGDLDLSESYSSQLAEAPGVDSKEVGDFSIFTHREPITILARKSAIVPMFTVSLSKAGVVLFYKESNHARRPYRALKFKNESQYSLGKGKTTIYNDGIFSGECVLEATKPGENRMLPHCLENGVKIIVDSKNVGDRRNSLRISEGVAMDERIFTGTTTYEIENKKDEDFKLAIEHRNLLEGQTRVLTTIEGVEVREEEKLAYGEGRRIYIDLPANQKLTMTVTETSSHVNKVTIGQSFTWLKCNVVDAKSSLKDDKQVQVCIGIQGEIDQLQVQKQEHKDRRDELQEQAARIRSNISAAKDVSNSETVAGWVRDLDRTELEIRNIDNVLIPKLHKTLKDFQSQLTEEINRISATWNDIQ